MIKLDSEGLLKAWAFVGGNAPGRLLLSRLIGRFIPYTGSLGAVVETLERGYTKLRLEDRRAVRNHLGSIHAVALANLGEFATGSAVITAIPSDARAILKSLRADYLKKARGTLTAEARVEPIESSERREVPVRGEIKDAAGVVVATVDAVWVVGPNKAKDKA